MGRIAWDRYEGNDVEAVVAMLINRDHPNSVRITPIVGDGGVDILDRGAADGKDVVYQVKRYTAPLTSKQKENVEESLDRVMSDPRWKDLDVGSWRLVTPWDPTPEADAWLQALGKARQLPVVWRGLTHVEQLVARYPDVADYYLEGGKSRVHEAYEKISALFTVDHNAEPLNVPNVATRIGKATEVLQTDPHYRYELRSGSGEPTATHRQGLAMTWIRAEGTGEERRWTAVDIIARCAASVVERPITVSGTFRADPNSDFAHTLRDFVDYGTPFATPAGGFEGTLDAPGGLGGTLVDAVARVLPVEGGAGEDPELLVESLDPSGTVIASTPLVRTERSGGQQGVRVVLRQENGAFEIEDRYNLSLASGKRQLRFNACTGEPVLAVRDAFQFLATCRPPNSVRLSRRMAGSATGLIDPTWAMPFPGDADEIVATIIRVLDVLATLQQHTAVVVRTPDLFAVTQQEFAEWKRAADILKGNTAVVRYPQGHALLVELGVDVGQPETDLTVSLPFKTGVAGQVLDFGAVEVHLRQPTLVERKEVAGGFLYAFTTADHSATFRLPARAE